MEMYVQSHVKTFRPLFLVMSKGTKRGLGLINFTYLLGADQGASFFLRVIERELSSEGITANADTRIARRSSIRITDEKKAVSLLMARCASNREQDLILTSVRSCTSAGGKLVPGECRRPGHGNVECQGGPCGCARDPRSG